MAQPARPVWQRSTLLQLHRCELSAKHKIKSNLGRIKIAKLILYNLP